MPKYYFEDFTIGRAFEGKYHTLTAQEIITYSLQFDPQPFHTDEEAGRRSHFGSLIAAGTLILAISVRVTYDTYLRDTAALGSPGIDEIRYVKPVRPGDTLTVRSTVVQAKPSGSKPDRGVAVLHREIFNQDGELVTHYRIATLLARRTLA